MMRLFELMSSLRFLSMGWGKDSPSAQSDNNESAQSFSLYILEIDRSAKCKTNKNLKWKALRMFFPVITWFMRTNHFTVADSGWLIPNLVDNQKQLHFVSIPSWFCFLLYRAKYIKKVLKSVTVFFKCKIVFVQNERHQLLTKRQNQKTYWNKTWF